MKRIFLLIPFVFLFQHAFSKQQYDSLLVKLNTTLDEKKQFDAEKVKRIESLKRQLNPAKNLSLNAQYNIYQKLYNEYNSFNYH